MVRKVKKPRGSMEPICATAQPISVLIADSNQMQCQLLVGALRRRPEFRVAFCSADMNLMLNAIAASSVQVAILNTDHRSEEHTSELQSLRHLVCRLLLEKKNLTK